VEDTHVHDAVLGHLQRGYVNGPRKFELVRADRLRVLPIMDANLKQLCVGGRRRTGQRVRPSGCIAAI
jgi:hypothetical protein